MIHHYQVISDEIGFEVLSSPLLLDGLNDNGKKPLQSVQFNTQNIEYHENDRTLSRKERQECWYDSATISTFKNEAMRDAEKMFALKGLNKILPPKLSPAKSKLGVVLRAYEDCLKVSTEEEASDCEFVAVDRQSIREVYLNSPRLCGLERVLFQTLRGQSSATVAFVLNTARERTQFVEDNDARERIYRRVSQRISRPCRVFARELALAHAATA
ncbi:hypothetical protein ACA910_021983 [Epithemia clementina (nom. ined.)]